MYSDKDDEISCRLQCDFCSFFKLFVLSFCFGGVVVEREGRGSLISMKITRRQFGEIRVVQVGVYPDVISRIHVLDRASE